MLDKMSKIAISRYTAKIITSQILLLLVSFSLLLYISILKQKELKANVVDEKESPINKIVSSYVLKECGNETGFEAYPEEPRLEDCEKMTTCRCNFCFADVAEITNNITICEKIFDSDIKVFCVGKIALNLTKCSDVNDIELREACLESIRLKTAGK